MVAAQHLDRDRLGLRLLGRLAPDVPDGDDRDDDLLRHRPAVDEASAAGEVERFAPLGIQNSMSPSAPAVTLILPCHAASWSGRFVADQVALLGQHRAVRLVVSLLLSVSTRADLGEQEAVVGGDDDVVAVQVVDDVPDQRRQFVDGLPHRLEGLAPRSWPSSPTASTVLW